MALKMLAANEMPDKTSICSMRTLVIVAVALVYVLTASDCKARLGETLAQCIARYGQPVPTTENYLKAVPVCDSAVLFQKSGFNVVVYILHGDVGAEFITKMNASALSDTEKQTLLDSESNDSTWDRSEKQSPGIDEAYLREDGKACAFYTNPNLMLFTKACYELNRAKDASDEKTKLNGF
jgi:hypothetical protein